MKIYVFTDFSPISDKALKVATNLAKLHDVPIELVFNDNDKEYLKHPRRLLEAKIMSWQRFGVDIRAQLVEARVQDLEETLKIEPDDFVFLGAHGESGVSNKWLGSIAMKTMRSVNCHRVFVPDIETDWVLEELAYISSNKSENALNILKETLEFFNQTFKTPVHKFEIDIDDKKSTNEELYTSLERFQLQGEVSMLSNLESYIQQADIDMISIDPYLLHKQFPNFHIYLAELLLLRIDRPLHLPKNP